MRVTVLIIGLLLGAIMFLQTFLVNVLGQAGNDENVEQAAAVGVFMSLLWLIACAFVVPLPMVSVVLFVAASIFGFAASGEFPDLGIWGGVSAALGVLSFLGWRGKRKERRTFMLEKARQDERDARMETLLQQQARTQQAASQFPCPSCGGMNGTGTRFCGGCGTALGAPTA